MLIVRTPLRISLVGGGTDIPSIYKEIGYGKVLSLAINKYIYLSVHPLIEDEDILLKYRLTEKVSQASSLKHPSAREVLMKFKLKSLDISITSDIPAGTGMGSSSSFTVGMLHMIYEYLKLKYDKKLIAELACEIEINKLKEPIGKQDQYIASLGGIQNLLFKSTEEVLNTNLGDNFLLIQEVSKYLHLVRVGKERSAGKLLSIQQENMKNKPSILKSYVDLIKLSDLAVDSLLKKDFHSLGEIISESWSIKRGLSEHISNSEIDEIISGGLEMGAWGGKLLGAGGAGFIFFLGDDDFEQQLRKKFPNRYLKVKVDEFGSKVVYNE